VVNGDRYTFLGHPLSDEMAAKFPDRLALFDNRYGTHVVRQRTAPYVGVPRRAVTS
jgi:hypothetical protein